MTLCVGFTGTSDYQREAQLEALKLKLKELRFDEFHHGDCINADENAHEIVMMCTTATVVIHPPLNTHARAYCKGEASRIIRREPKPYLARNHDIVDETDLLIACPRSKLEQRRSGTWATVRYARKVGKPVILITPDGKIRVGGVK